MPSDAADGVPFAAADLKFISLMDCTAAGDYRWLELDREGSLHFLRAGSSLRLFKVQRENVPITSREPLFGQIEAVGFFRLNSIYQLRPEPGEEVEHRYYALTAGSERVHTVVAHEYAMPDGLQRLITSLQRLGSSSPSEPPSNSYLMAVPAAMLVCLGEDARPVDPEAMDQSLAGYLQRAARPRGHSIEVPPAVLPDLKERVFAAHNVVRLLGGDDLALVLFENPR
jgi:hypothetical protein